LGTLGATVSVELRRLNVDDVALFDGTKSHGRYQVIPKDLCALSAGSPTLSPWNPTGTGLDLLPGEYRVDIRYANETRQQILDVDLR
jgi:hypothetical protein